MAVELPTSLALFSQHFIDDFDYEEASIDHYQRHGTKQGLR